VAYSVSLIGIVGAGGVLIFAGGMVNEFLRAVLFCVLVISLIIAAKNTLTAFGFAAGAEIMRAAASKSDKTNDFKIGWWIGVV
jgi:type IV secretory pathway VirB2 component (pilin)